MQKGRGTVSCSREEEAGGRGSISCSREEEAGGRGTVSCSGEEEAGGRTSSDERGGEEGSQGRAVLRSLYSEGSYVSGSPVLCVPCPHKGPC